MYLVHAVQRRDAAVAVDARPPHGRRGEREPSDPAHDGGQPVGHMHDVVAYDAAAHARAGDKPEPPNASLPRCCLDLLEGE